MGRKRQGGALLIEAMIGIFIFSVGVLAVVAMQGRAIAQVSDSKYRVDASFLANELVSRAWVDRANIATYVYPNGTAPALTAWVVKVGNTLPGTATHPPTVAIDATTGQITVTVRWQPPQTAVVSSHTAVAVVANP